MQQSKIKTNVLIIGKSGVGKSSLLNYIFGKELEKTGAGKQYRKELTRMIMSMMMSLLFQYQIRRD